MKNLINFCPKCGSKNIEVEKELVQYNVFCCDCNIFLEIIVIDSGDFYSSVELPEN